MSTAAILQTINSLNDDQITDEFVESFKLMLNNPNFKNIHADIAIKLEKYNKAKNKNIPESTELIINPVLGDFYETNNNSVLMLSRFFEDDKRVEFLLIKGGYNPNKTKLVDPLMLMMGMTVRGKIGEYLYTDVKGRFVTEEENPIYEMHIKRKCELVIKEPQTVI